MIHLTKTTSTYTFSPHHPPAIRIDPGTTIQFETLDALNGQIRSDEDSANQIDLDHVNAATGPVYLNGARPGDTLVAEILEIQPADWGSALIIPGFGFLQDILPGPRTMILHQSMDGLFKFNDSIHIPLKPMIGTIGVAPLEPITTLSSGAHGGNLDTTDIRPGSTVFLPVFVEGALFGIGDVHARMGDGEVCGTGIECSAQVTIRLDLMHDRPIYRPRIETEDEVMCVASAQGLDAAIRLALLDMVEWLQQEKNLTAEEAYMLASIAGDVRIGQVVDPMVTVRVAVPKEIFTPLSLSAPSRMSPLS
jgi:amidase